ncbi:MAG TPA: helix-turn-helix domain-containing protein, partial [Anaerolinea sp.]|nr:helix-turn-helix domain-containing protein [Anaerolinea sp.]
MIDPRKTGAYISKLRREKDWTQLDLAERLHVTPQAVSRWETGDSFPDIALLSQLAQIFRVSVDNLLNGQPASIFRDRRKVTAGDLLTELAEGHPETVAKLVREEKAGMEELLDVAPLTRPSTMDKVVEGLTGFSLSIEQIVQLAPFVSQDVLGAVLEEVIDTPGSQNIIGELAPWLDRETLDRWVERAINGEVEGSLLTTLAPFLSRETLDGLVEHVKDGGIEL